MNDLWRKTAHVELLSRTSRFLCPRPGGIKWWCCLTSAVWPLSCTSSGWAACVAGQLDGAYWMIGLGRPGSRLLLRSSIAGLGGAWSGGRPPTACLDENRLSGIESWIVSLLTTTPECFIDFRANQASYVTNIFPAFYAVFFVLCSCGIWQLQTIIAVAELFVSFSCEGCISVLLFTCAP